MTIEMESTTCNYLIKLRPLTPYFFGGERTLGDDKSNYYARSNRLPQQSAILGLLRYQLLKSNGILPITEDNRQKANELIGSKSFDIKENIFKFGAIKRLSPLYLSKGDIFYTHLPLDWGFDICRCDERSYISGISHAKCIESKDFDSKTWWNNGRWIADHTTPEEGDSDWISDAKIFHTTTKIGITKNRDNGDEKKFFKIEYCMLEKDYAFACFVQLEEKAKLTSDIVYLGAERSVFRMEVTQLEKTSDGQMPSAYPNFSGRFSKSTGQIILLSDSLVSDEVVQKSIFIVGGTVPFRNIQTTTATKNYYDRNKVSGFSKSGRYNLLMRGSVIFCEDADIELISQNITDNQNLICAGYNHILIKTTIK